MIENLTNVVTPDKEFLDSAIAVAKKRFASLFDPTQSLALVAALSAFTPGPVGRPFSFIPILKIRS